MTPLPDSHGLPGLRWGIKSSFVQYIVRMPDGKGSVSHGAMPTESNEFLYEWAPSTETTQAGDADHVWQFRGDVRFAGHHGMLFVRIADPWMAVRGERATLSVRHPYERDGPRMDLVTLDVAPVPSSGGRVWNGTNVRLTEDGVELFGDVYQLGEPFDPLTITMPNT